MESSSPVLPAHTSYSDSFLNASSSFSRTWAKLTPGSLGDLLARRKKGGTPESHSPPSSSRSSSPPSSPTGSLGERSAEALNDYFAPFDTIISREAVPRKFQCPLTGEIMEDPVRDSAGHTFEKKAIMGWINCGNEECPDGFESIALSDLTPDLPLKQAIEEWKREKREVIPFFLSLDEPQDPDLAGALIALTQEFSERGCYKEAVEKYEKALEYTNKIEDYASYAKLLETTGYLFKASRAYGFLARAYEKRGDSSMAENAYQSAVKLVPQERSFHEELVAYFIREGKIKEAVFCYEQLIRLAKAKKYSIVLEEYYKKLIELEPDQKKHSQRYLDFLKAKKRNEEVMELEKKMRDMDERRIEKLRGTLAREQRIQKCIREIDFRGESLEAINIGLHHIGSCSGLKSICFKGCRELTDEGLLPLMEVHTLEKVDLSGCVEVSASMIRKLLKANPKMKKLKLEGSKVDVCLFEDILWYGLHLRFISLKDCENVSDEQVKNVAMDFSLTCVLPSGTRAQIEPVRRSEAKKNYAAGPARITEIVKNEGGILSLIPLPDGRFVSGGTAVKIWDVPKSSRAPSQKSICRYQEGECSCLLSLPGGRLAVGDSNNTITIWNVKMEKSECSLSNHGGKIYSLAQLPGGRLVSGDEKGVINIWDVEEAKLLEGFKAHTNWVNTLVPLPNGKLASGSLDATVKIWDLKTGTCVHTLTHEESVFSVVALSSNRLASGSLDKKIKIWDVESGECLQILGEHQRSVLCLVVLDDGRLASGSSDGTVKFWDIDKAQCLYTEDKGSLDGVNHLMQLSDGQLVIYRKRGSLYTLIFGDAWQSWVRHSRRVKSS